MSEDRQFELVEVTRKKQTGSSGRTAQKAAEQPGDSGSGQRHRYANVEDPYGLRRHRANGAASDGDFLRAAQANSEKEIRLHHEQTSESAWRTGEDESGAPQTDRIGAPGETHRSHSHSRGSRYRDYGTVSLGSLPRQDSDAADKAADNLTSGTVSERPSGGDVYTRVMNRKYKGNSKKWIRIWIAVIVLVAALLLVFFFSRRTIEDTLLPKPNEESLPEETFKEVETIQSNE